MLSRGVLQVDENNVPSDKLTGGSLVTCEEIGSSASTVQDAMDDPKVSHGVPGGWTDQSSPTFVGLLLLLGVGDKQGWAVSIDVGVGLPRDAVLVSAETR